MDYDKQLAEWQDKGYACKQCGDLELIEPDEGVANGPLNAEGLCTNCVESNGMKPLTHDYPVALVKASAINGTHVLVGECGGLSAVFSAEPSAAMPGCTAISTEHGYLYVDTDRELEVLDND